MGSIDQLSKMDSLSPQNFNEFVKSRSRSPSPLRDVSPSRQNVWARAHDDMEDAPYNIPTPVENIGCQELLGYHCSHCGWLRKRRNMKTLNQIFSWPQAYVVLYDGCMYYYKNERSRSPTGKFSLYGYNSVYRASEILPKEAPWSFKIVHSHREFKTYFFSASSEQEMKAWMSCIKKELLHANGKSALYGKDLNKDKGDKQDALDDSKFYQDIEQNIYDDSCKFIPTKDYMKKCSVKRENEDSDDDDLIINPEIDNRPPCPLPTDQQKICDPLRPPVKPPRTPEEPAPLKPETPPRTRREPTKSRDASPNTQKMKALQIGEELKKRKNPKRRGSYEKTDGPGQKSPAGVQQFNFDYKSVTQHSGGGSTGEDEAEHFDPDEYWGSIHFDDKDKNKANDIIQGIGENGVYLVRPENAGPGKVLVVYAGDQTKKYRIKESPESQYYLAEEGFHHSSLEEMLYYYYHNDLPTISQKLIQPYRLHPKYKNLNI